MPAKRLTWLLPLLPLAVHAALVGYVVDGDGDGVPDERDLCPYTPPGAVVDEFGCSGLEDLDGDGVPDLIDRCPFTPPGAVVDAFGCAVDSDFDGVADGLDLCPGTPLGAVVDERGCAWGQVPVSGTRLALTPVPTVMPTAAPAPAPTAPPVAVHAPAETQGSAAPVTMTLDPSSIPLATPAPAVSQRSPMPAAARPVAVRLRLAPLQVPVDSAMPGEAPPVAAAVAAAEPAVPPQAPLPPPQGTVRAGSDAPTMVSSRASGEVKPLRPPPSAPVEAPPRQWVTEVVFETEQLSEAWKAGLRDRLLQGANGAAEIEVVGFTNAELPSSRVIPRVLQVEALVKQWGIPPERIRHVIRPAAPGQRVGTVVVYRR